MVKPGGGLGAVAAPTSPHFWPRLPYTPVDGLAISRPVAQALRPTLLGKALDAAADFARPITSIVPARGAGHAYHPTGPSTIGIIYQAPSSAVVRAEHLAAQE
jgi:hypothetical protein